MTPDDSIRLSLQDIIKSNIDSKYMADYGTVTAVYGTPVATVDVQHNAMGSLTLMAILSLTLVMP